MSDDYRLEPLRGERSRDERIKRGDLADAVTHARTTEAELTAAANRVNAARAALDAARDASGSSLATAAARANADRFVMRARRGLDQAIEAQLRAEAAHRGQLASVDIARQQHAAARAHRELIERHFARWRSERAKLAARRED